MRENLVVYTALFGRYDELIDPSENFFGCEFICFTDRKDLSSKIWKIVVVSNIFLSPNMMNRDYKLRPYLFIKNLRRSLYVDSNIKIKSHPEGWINQNAKSIQLPLHFSRNCIFEEAREVILNKKAPLDKVIEQIEYYKMSGMPNNFGLMENNIIYRDFSDPSVRFIMEEWWVQLNRFTQRDQLSLMFILWKNRFEVGYTDIGARGNKYFSIRPHLSPAFDAPILGLIRYNLASYIDNHPGSFLVKIIHRIKYLLKKFRFHHNGI
jgi:hypothetical protein